MTRWRPMRAASAMALVGALWLMSGDASAQRTAFGDTIKAARLLSEWRFDDARRVIAQLDKSAPNTPETRYLKGELAFLDGDYAGALKLIDGVDDKVASGSVGELRSLAASTLSVTRQFASRESPGGHFVIFYEPGKDEAIVDLAGEVLDAAYRELGRDFDFYPTRKIRVELLSRPSDLAKLSPLSEREIETTGTIALCKYNKLMVVSPRATIFGYPWMDTLVHEYVHYVVSQKSHDKVPVWLHEGLARFQQTRWRKPPDDALTATDEHLLATALKRKDLITFEQMHPSMAKLPSQEAAALAFAEVFTMVSYLHERVGYDGIRKMIALTKTGKSARRAVAEVVGKRWAQVERDWKSYLRGRNLKPSKALAGRAKSRRIRFGKGDKSGENAENVGIDEVASAKARKFTRLGGMLRARGMVEAAAKEYEKALAIVGPSDPFVAAKLSRTYLDLSEHHKAIQLAGPLAAADENDAAPAVTLGLANFALGNLTEAQGAFEAALRINPFDPSVRCTLAEIYGKTGDASRADRERKACELLRP